MKRIISLLACLSMILLTACSSSDDEAVSELPTETVATTTSTVVSSSFIESKTEPSKKMEFSILSQDLTKEIQNDYYSMNVSPEWEIIDEKHDDDGDLIEYELYTNVDMTIEVTGDGGFRFKSGIDSPTNDDYINYRVSNYSAKTYTSKNNLKFTYDTNDSGTYFRYRFYSQFKVVTITFRTWLNSGFYFIPECVENVIDTIYFPEKTSEVTTANPPSSESHPIAFSGKGDKVTDTFTANGCSIIKGDYYGDSVFFVMLYDSEGNTEGMIFSNMGQYSGEKVFKFENNKKYMFEVTASDDDWMLTVE